MKKIYRSENYVVVIYDGVNEKLYPISQVQLSEFTDHFLIENRIENQPEDTQVSFARIDEWFNEAGDTAYSVQTLRAFFLGISATGASSEDLDAVEVIAKGATFGYSHTGAFADKPLSNNYVWEPGAGVSYAQADVDAELWKVFSLDAAVHAAVDNPYWSTPTPTGNTGIGLFQGANLPYDVTSLFDYSFDFDAAYPAGEVELWLFENQGGNRDSGNNVQYVDENGATQNIFVNNNGSTTVWYSSTEYTTMPVVTGDSYNLHRLKGQANIDATFSQDPTVSFSLVEFYAAVALAETEAEVQAEYDAGGGGGGATTGFEGTTGRIKLNDCQYGDQLRVRFDFEIIPQIANTTVEPALWYSNRSDSDEITFTFPLTAQPIFYGQGTVGRAFLNRVEISAWITSNEDVNALTLPAIKSDNPVIIRPLGLLVTILR